MEELCEHLDESKASYAYARIRYSNDKESHREKFILIIWIGQSCKVMRKAKVRDSTLNGHRSITSQYSRQISVHAADVKQVLRVFSIEVPAREKDDLKMEPIVVKLRKVRPSQMIVCVVC